MKVVIFCGGLGVRMGEETRRIPKPMITIGGKPMLWHIMEYYASWGHTEFVLCLGYKGEVIKEYFLSYNEALFNDFVLEHNGSGSTVELLSPARPQWRITFADTGISTTIGERLTAVRSYVGDETEFLATYGDGLTDLRLPDLIETFHASGRTAIFLSVRPEIYSHLVTHDDDGVVLTVEELRHSHVRINGGFFVFKQKIFDLIEPGDDLVDAPFSRLMERRELMAYPYEGFFGPMDTIKDRQRLEALYEAGAAPWLRSAEDDVPDRPGP
jgi:glucose-1-phosphate cytidylyltransferase